MILPEKVLKLVIISRIMILVLFISSELKII